MWTVKAMHKEVCVAYVIMHSAENDTTHAIVDNKWGTVQTHNASITK